MPKITPFLWFDNQAEEAANFYVSIFKNSKITKTTRYGPNMPPARRHPHDHRLHPRRPGLHHCPQRRPPLHHQRHTISFVVPCDTQSEVDHYWDKLSAGGKPIQCGWLPPDKFGVTCSKSSPPSSPQLLADPNPKKASATAQAMMKMIKLDIPQLQAAYNNA